MNRETFTTLLDARLKLVRNEIGYTQDQMAEVLGLSKKTLVQIEKGRTSLGWMGAVALCGIFPDSAVLQMTLGGNPQDLVLTLAFTDYEKAYPQTLGGRVWWKEIEARAGYRIQQNIISQHYRILDASDRRICASLQLIHIKQRLLELARISRRQQPGRAA